MVRTCRPFSRLVASGGLAVAVLCIGSPSQAQGAFVVSSAMRAPVSSAIYQRHVVLDTESPWVGVALSVSRPTPIQLDVRWPWLAGGVASSPVVVPAQPRVVSDPGLVAPLRRPVVLDTSDPWSTGSVAPTVAEHRISLPDRAAPTAAVPAPKPPEHQVPTAAFPPLP